MNTRTAKSCNSSVKTIVLLIVFFCFRRNAQAFPMNEKPIITSNICCLSLSPVQFVIEKSPRSSRQKLDGHLSPRAAFWETATDRCTPTLISILENAKMTAPPPRPPPKNTEQKKSPCMPCCLSFTVYHPSSVQHVSVKHEPLIDGTSSVSAAVTRSNYRTVPDRSPVVGRSCLHLRHDEIFEQQAKDSISR